MVAANNLVKWLAPRSRVLGSVRDLTLTLTLLLVAKSVSAQASAETQPVRTALLGQEQQVQLPAPSGVNASELTWKANVGTANASPEGSSYQLPKTSFPQVALVGAYDPKTRTPLVHRVLLVGSPTIEIRSEPNVKVTVEVGGRKFGPTSTDAKGLARLKIEASPGVTTVKTFATDSYGNVTEGQLGLDPPPFPRHLVMCAPLEEAAYVVLVNEQGDFADAPSFETDVTLATAKPPEAVAPGIFRVPLTVPIPEREWKTVNVNVAHGGFSDSCSFKVAPPPPSKPFKLTGAVTPVEPAFTLFVGANAGFATNFGLLAGPWVSLQASYPFSSTRDGLRLELAVAYTHSNSDVDTEDGQTLELTVDSIPLLLGPRYVLAFGLLHLHAGVHGGISFTSESLVGPLTDQAASSIPLWVGGDIGVAWWIGSGDIGINAAYDYAPIKQDEVSGNVAGLRAVVQYERGF